jgi:TonB family protein
LKKSLAAIPFLLLASLTGLYAQTENPAAPVAPAKTSKDNFALVNGVLEQNGGDIPASRVTNPKLTHKERIKFPHHRRETGTATYQLVVGLDGKPTDIKVLQSFRADYDEQAIKSIRKYRFTPAELDGKPCADQINIVVNFSRW